jgi:hypothetical protein
MELDIWCPPNTLANFFVCFKEHKLDIHPSIHPSGGPWNAVQNVAQIQELSTTQKP